MWTKPSNEFDKRSSRLKLKRTAIQIPSAQVGARCSLQTWQAEGKTARNHLVFLHGALAYGGRHAAMFEWMIARFNGELKVHALDAVGHGISTGPRAHVERFTVYMEDFLSVLTLLKREHPDDDFFIMGHSMGGLISLKTLLENEQRLPFQPKGLILTNPCIRPQQVVDFPRIADVLNGISQRFPQMRFPRMLKGKDVALDPEAANAFETDPLIPHFLTARMVREIWYACEEVRALSYFVKVPTLFLVSDEDKVVDREATLLFARGIDKKWVTVNNYKNAAHEILHENIRQKVWRDIVDWVGSRMEAT